MPKKVTRVAIVCVHPNGTCSWACEFRRDDLPEEETE